MPRICFLAGTLAKGGAEQQLFYIVRALHDAGTDVRVLSLTRDEYWERRIRDLGVAVTWVGRSRFKLGRLLQVVRELRRDLPDVIQSQHFYTTPYVAGAARLLGIRDIGAIRCDMIAEWRDSGRWLGRLSLHAPRTIAANSEAGIRNAVAAGVRPSRLHLLPNVVDTQVFTPVARNDRDVVTLLLIGRLTAQKRVDRFLTLLKTLQQQVTHRFRGLIVGHGPDRERLERQARDLGLLENTVEFRGAVDSPRAVYQEADVLVLTSDYEGTPNVVLEAMASGLPIVATKVGDVPVIVRDGETGFLVAPDDNHALTARVADLIENGQLRTQVGRNARAYVEEYLSVHRLPQMLDALYADVARSRS